ncbi:MAG: hypothetical protein QOG23_5711 [Blastocatellia bacterium]|jgi:aspartate racemase|nr:hypothetical protein [Blastocatellia bacterium]
MSKQENTIRRAGLSAAKLALLERRLSRKTIQPERAENALKRLRQESAPLSFSQEDTAAAARAEGKPSYYNIVVRFRGEIDIAALERTLGEVVRRHESLRTGFPMRDGRRVQIVAPPSPRLPLALCDVSDLTDEEREERALQLAVEQVRKPFDLAEPQLFRASLLRLGEAHHLLLLAIAHIVCDSQSLEILTREMSVIYEAFSQGRPSPLPDLPIQCADYASWQHARLRGEYLETLLAYWRRQLDGCPMLCLPTAGSRPPARTFRGAYRSVLMSKTLAVNLERLSLDEGVTPFMTLMAAFKVLLHRLTGQDDIIVGSATAGRQHRELEGLIGCFINLLAFRTRLSGDPTFRELLRRVSETARGAYNHQEMPFGKLVGELQLPCDESYPTLVQVIFAFSRTTGGATESAPPGVSSYMINPERSSVDLTLSMKDAPHGLLATLEYNTDLFEAAAIDEMLKDLQSLLEAVATDPDLRLSALAAHDG